MSVLIGRMILFVKSAILQDHALAGAYKHIVSEQKTMTSNDPLLRPYPSGRPSYFVLLQWSGEEILNIRDFRYARYAIEDAEVIAA